MLSLLPHLSLFLVSSLIKVLKLNPASVPPDTELNLGDKVLDAVEKNSFIALQGKGGYRGLVPSKLCFEATWRGQ